MAIENEYKAAYSKNEISANKHMSFALLFAAALLLLALIGYIFNVFGVDRDAQILTLIVTPITIVLLCLPICFIKSRFIASPKFKYITLFIFVLTMTILNIIMPKHAILGWAVCIIVTGHYYSPKLTRIILFTVIVLMAVALGLATFIGEFDANLLSGELNEADGMIYNFRLPDPYPDTIAGRIEYIKALREAGENRFLAIYANYYFARVLFIALIFAVTVFLNRRTHTLLKSEITVNNENQKNKTELEVAKEIQLNTLPDEFTSTKDVEIVGELKAAKEVGGDLYDYLNIDEDHVAILIGDVSGKGVPAAMFMMKTITSFRDFAKKDKKPSQILKEMNDSIIKGNKRSLFVTCFLAILDKRNGKVVYANAGHNPPIIGLNKDFRYLKCDSGMLLGVFKNIAIVDEEVTLNPGESLTIYTDGITEARNANGEFFGEERFINLINKHSYTCVIEFHHAIKDEVAGFVKGAPQSDDITFLTIKYRGDNYSYKEKEFSAKKEHIIEMLGFISDFVNEYNLPNEFKNKLVVVGDEIISNIIKYGYKDNGGPIFIRMLYDIDSKEFAMTIIDKAEAFNQLSVQGKKMQDDIKKQEIGGLGILIVKTIMDEYAYDRINDKNILVLKKKF